MRSFNYRQTSLWIISVIFFISAFLYVVLKGNEGYHLPKAIEASNMVTSDLSADAIAVDETFEVYTYSSAHTNYHSKKLAVDGSFTSNLPIILINTNDERPPRNIDWSDEMDCFMPIENVEPYVTGTISVLDKKGKANSLTDTPVMESCVRMRRRGNSSNNYDKNQYLLKLTDANGNKVKRNILDMGADSEWVLNGSFADKSQLRNYLSYTVAGEIMPYTPDARFCEVIWKDSDGYQYEGIYLVIENLTVGEHRVNLPSFSENSENLPFLIRRDRYDPNGCMLENYAKRNELLYGILDIKWPDESVLTKQAVQRITDKIDRFEETLFAEDYEEFIKYRDYVDINSFADYFILNEFFLNYDAGYNSTYVYSDYSGKLTMGPVWDYDQAIDNAQENSANLYTTAFHSAPWFEQMLRDPEFTLLIIERYQELRGSILSDEAIQTFLDETIEGLGPAIDREWARWGYYYEHGGYLKQENTSLPDRNTKTFDEEIDKIKFVLSEHGAWLDEHIDSLYQFSDPNIVPLDKEAEILIPWNDKSALAVVYMGVFFISIMLVQRVEREA